MGSKLNHIFVLDASMLLALCYMQRLFQMVIHFEEVKITKSRINFSPKTSAKEMEDEIIKALEFSQRYKNRKRDRMRDKGD